MTDPQPLHGRRILVLEDDFYLAREAQLLLEKAGAEVVGPFGTAFRSEELTTAGRLDAAVVDINMGRGPSFNVARLLRTLSVPFVFVTGYDAAIIPPDLSTVLRIEKPVRPRVLVAALAHLTG